MDSPVTPPLRIVLLGADEATLALARAISGEGRFELAGVCELDGGGTALGSAALAALVGRARGIDAWEALLDQQAVDAVVVARTADEDRRAEQLRKLIQAGVPVLASHPLFDSMLVYYELDMIRRDTNCVVLPALTERQHPAVMRLAEMVRQVGESPIGKVEQVVMQRCIAVSAKPNVVAEFARDVDLLRSVAGEITRLGAMAGASGDSAFGSLGVQMSGPEGIVVRWSIVPSQSDQGAEMTLLGSIGKAVLGVRPALEPWTLEVTTPEKSEPTRFDPWDPAAAALDTFARAIRGEPVEPDWVDAARSVELTETIDRSLKKGRTIELYYEDYTEEGTFKGTMTSVGCGLLLMGMFLLGAVGLAELAGVPYTRYWPQVLLGLLGVFLVLQLLMFVSRKAEPRAEAGPPVDQPRHDL